MTKFGVDMESCGRERNRTLSGCARILCSKGRTLLTVTRKLGLCLGDGLGAYLVHWLVAIGVNGWSFRCQWTEMKLIFKFGKPKGYPQRLVSLAPIPLASLWLYSYLSAMKSSVASKKLKTTRRSIYNTSQRARLHVIIRKSKSHKQSMSVLLRIFRSKKGSNI